MLAASEFTPELPGSASLPWDAYLSRGWELLAFKGLLHQALRKSSEIQQSKLCSKLPSGKEQALPYI